MLASASDFRNRCRAVLFVACAMLSGAESPALGQDADTLLKEGEALFVQGRIAEACQKFADAASLKHTVMIRRRLGSCHVAMGMAKTAQRELQEVVQDATVQGDTETVTRARENLAKIDAEGPFLRVNVLGDKEATRDVTVVVDDEPVPPGLWNNPQPIDAGEHAVVFQTPLVYYPEKITFKLGDRIVNRSMTVGKARLVRSADLPGLVVEMDGIKIDGEQLDKVVTVKMGEHTVKVSSEGHDPYFLPLVVPESGALAEVSILKPAGQLCTGSAECNTGHCVNGVCCYRDCTSNERCGVPSGNCEAKDPREARRNAGLVIATFGGLHLVAGIISGFFLMGSSIARSQAESCKNGAPCTARTIQIQSIWSTIINGSAGGVLVTTGLLMFPSRASRPTNVVRLVPVASERGGGFSLSGTF